MAFGVSKNQHYHGNSLRSCRHYYNFCSPNGETMVLAVGLNNGRIKIFTLTGKERIVLDFILALVEFILRFQED